ncbi:hypothetical protein FA95DRAFT_1579784 [Auriscalpium vulgare]|uniref:Uncharacterized protein n=1 Tax=Auriscalpium vulgare TaxID=40419 RepID=A0ACB8S8E8_9AGAM|nr:hypothetical protein FA95DRAFT_1579784 [Auriscalpium vulgare]
MRIPIRAILLDLSGTLHIASNPTLNAPQALQRLRDAQIPLRFCSNTSKESTESLRGRLTSMGLGPREGELYTSIGAVKGVLHARGIKRPYVIASETAKQDVLSDTSENGDADAPFDGVVVALAPSELDYAHLNIAFRVLMREHGPQSSSRASSAPIPLIATHRARFLEDKDSRLSLGPGPFVAALENATGTTAEVVGKPERAFFEATLAGVGEREGRVVIVGDDVQNDLNGGALELGLFRVLVRTGKYRPGDESKEGLVPPDEVHDSFATFVDSLFQV